MIIAIKGGTMTDVNTKNKQQLIALCGLIGSGKDTAADYLVNFYGYRRDSFASTLKDAVSAIFGWDRELLEGRTRESREWREEVDLWWSARLDRVITPRWVLQQWGTEVGRRSFHDDIWIASMENKLRQTADNTVITDCRFPNEVESIRSVGGKVVRIMRGPDPVWFETARHDPHLMPQNYPGVHASEYSWAPVVFDHTIDNNGTIEELYQQIKNLL